MLCLVVHIVDIAMLYVIAHHLALLMPVVRHVWGVTVTMCCGMVCDFLQHTVLVFAEDAFLSWSGTRLVAVVIVCVAGTDNSTDCV